MIKFVSILSRYEASELSQLEAGELLGMGERTFRRWRQRFEDEGEAGLLDRRLGKASGKRVPSDRSEEVEMLYRTRYAGFTAKHFHERLVQDHNFGWGYTWTKTFLHSKGLLEKAKRRGAHRRKRERRPLQGMMLHQDGSRHVWLSGQPALDLIVTLDDATNAIYSAFLIEEEGTDSTFRALTEVFGAHGLPLSLYTDRGSHYFHTPVAGGEVDRSRPTQVGRALERLGVEHIAAYSPQARGRSERASRPCRIGWSRNWRWPGSPRSMRPIDSCATSISLRITRALRLRRRSRVRRSWRSPASIFPRFYACRRSVRSATTIACRSTGSSCRSRKARCAPISSRRA